MYTRAVGKALGRTGSRSRGGGGEPRGALGAFLAALLLVLCGGRAFAEEARPRAESLPAFQEIEEVSQRKQRFFDFLTPVIRAENDRLRLERSRLLAVASAWKAGTISGPRASVLVTTLARAYGLDAAASQPAQLVAELLERVDVVPRSLVLAQAAKESGWGRSRFARRANNLFGQWCFDPGCGLVPRQRPAGMSHEVRSFASIRDSVASYMRNLNTHPSYERFRALRAELRRMLRPLSGTRLAEGLTRYSAQGDRYVREVQTMIRQNGRDHVP